MTDPTANAPDPGNERGMTRLAAYGVIRREGRVLLCRIGPGYPASGEWTLPGGGLDFGEAPWDGAIREVAEETGLEAEITGNVTVLSDAGWLPRSGLPIRYHQVRFVYPMVIVGGEERVEIGGSTDAFGWFTDAEVTALRVVELVELALGSEREQP